MGLADPTKSQVDTAKPWARLRLAYPVASILKILARRFSVRYREGDPKWTKSAYRGGGEQVLLRIMNPKFLRLHWADQVTSAPRKTTDFYSDLLGFGQLPVEEPNDCTSYCLTDEDGDEIFGIVDEANFKDWPSGWVLYFEVDDYEKQCARVEEMGGTILYKAPNQCLIRDPSGAPIVLNPAKSDGEQGVNPNA